MNIVLVTVDSLRADHCGWQSDTNTTPNLDELATESLTFTSAIAPGPRTPSSVPVTHTGVPFARNGHDTSQYEGRAARIRSHIEQFPTISQLLHEEGYTNVAFTANFWTTPDTAFDTGFDRFEEVGRTGGNVYALFEGTPVEKPARLFDRWLHNDTWFSQWRTFYDDVVTTIDQVDDPVFAWVFLLDTHNPYLVPRADRREASAYGMYSAFFRANRVLKQTAGRTAYDTSLDGDTLEKLERAYRDSVRSVDTFVDRLLSDIDDETVLLFHSDHGEAFGEHGTYGHQPVLYEENIHVPLLIQGAGTADTIDRPLSTAEMQEMLVSYARGEDLEPTQWTADYAVARTEADDAIAVRGDRWKYIQTGDTEGLYDLNEDPAETDDVADDNPAVLSEFRTERDRYLNSLPASPSSSGSLESDGIKERLRSLGYLQDDG